MTATNGSPAFYSAGLRIGGTVISGTGSVTQSAGLVSIQNCYIMIGDTGVGSYVMTGGTLQQGGSGDLRTLIGWSGAAPTGSLVVSGNAVASLGGDLDMGYNGNATVTVSQSGSLTMAGTTNFAQNAGSEGTLNLNGGTLATNGLSVGSGRATVNFNGGMLMAASSFNTPLPMTINAGGAVFNTNGQTLTLSGPLVGTGGLTAVGNGTLVITAGNTYSGGTTISAGTLQIDNGGATGSLTGNIVNNGTLVFDRSDNPTFGGSISGSGSVTQAGGGVLTLSGSNTYSGGTTVNTGALVATNSSAVGANSSLSVAYGATFAYQPVAVEALNMGSGALTLAANSTLGVALGGTAGQSAILSSGMASLGGTITVNIWSVPGAAPAAGTNNLITAAGGLDTGTFLLGNVYNATNYSLGNLTQSATALTVNVTSQAAPANLYWQGAFSGGNNVWAVSNGLTVGGASNWTTDAAGTAATSLFPGRPRRSTSRPPARPTRGATVLGANMSIAGLTVSDTNSVSLAADGNVLTIGGAGITVNSGAGPVTISAPMTMSAPQSWTNNAANPLTISGPVNNGGNLLTVAGSGTTTLSSAISGMGGLTKIGAGTLAVTAAQSYSGPTIISSGVLQLHGGLLLPSVGSTLQYDLDASDPASVGVTPGQPVTSWNDVSGNGRNFTNGTAAAPTLVANVFGSLPAVQFDGSTTSLNYSGGNVTAQTVFIVAIDGGRASLGGIWGSYGGDNGIRTDTSTAWRGNPGNTNGGDYTNNGTTFITTGPASFDVNTTSFTAGRCRFWSPTETRPTPTPG